MSEDQTNRRSLFQKFGRREVQRTDAANMSFVDHLEALRWHLFRAVLVWLIVTVIIFIYVDWIFDNVIYGPARSDFFTYKAFCNLSHQLGLGEALCMPPVDIPLQGNTISGPFMSAISIAMTGGLILAFPYLFWELWRFIKPALSAKELRATRGSIFWVTLCFLTGAAFGYFILAPFTFNFLANFTLGTLGAYRYIPTLNDYVSTLTNILLGCGIAFELPVIAYVLARIGIISASLLKRSRRYALLGILIVAAILTPSPDWTSQLIVALPLVLLYELSIILCNRVDKRREKEEKVWS